MCVCFYFFPPPICTENLLCESVLGPHFDESMVVLRHTAMGVLVHHTCPQVLDQRHLRLDDNAAVLRQEMLGNDYAKLFNGGKLMAAGQDVDGVLAGIGGNDVAIVGFGEGLIHTALCILCVYI